MIFGRPRNRSGVQLPVPKHPYRDSLLFNLALAGVIVVFAALTGGDMVRALGWATAFLVLATGYSWWRFRQRLQAEAAAAEAEQRAEQRARERA